MLQPKPEVGQRRQRVGQERARPALADSPCTRDAGPQRLMMPAAGPLEQGKQVTMEKFTSDFADDYETVRHRWRHAAVEASP